MAPSMDLVRAIFTAWKRGDFSSAEWAAADIEWIVADGPEPSARTGLAWMVAEWHDFVSVWTGYRIEATEYHELDDERVLVIYERSGQGKTSGMELGQLRAKGASVFEVREGVVMRIVSYTDPDRLPTAESLRGPDAPPQRRPPDRAR